MADPVQQKAKHVRAVQARMLSRVRHDFPPTGPPPDTFPYVRAVHVYIRGRMKATIRLSEDSSRLVIDGDEQAAREYLDSSLGFSPESDPQRWLNDASVMYGVRLYSASGLVGLVALGDFIDALKKAKETKPRKTKK